MLTKRAVWVALILTLAVAVVKSSDTEAKVFLLTGPKHLLRGTKETFCLHLKGVQSAGRVLFQVTDNQSNATFGAQGSLRIDPKIDDYGSCIPLVLNVPDRIQSGRYKLVLQVTWDDANTDLKINTESPIVVSNEKTLVQLIQTDKPWYKPGQLVRIRTLGLTHLMQPVVTPADRVWVSNPDGTTVVEWHNFTSNLGLAQHDLQLSSQAAQGVWKIYTDYKGQVEQNVFEVKYFELPSLMVTIESTGSDLHHEQTFNFTVCAKSPAGQPVLGHVDVVAVVSSSFNPRDRDQKHTVEYVTFSGTLDTATGCHQIEFVLSRLGLKHEVQYDIKIEGQVTEQGTEEKQNATSHYSVTGKRDPYVLLDLHGGSSSTFQVGLPYLGQGSLSTGEIPIAHAQVSVCFKEGYQNLTSTSGDPVQYSSVQQCVNYTTDEQGRFAYFVVPRNSEAVRLSFQAKYKDGSKNLSQTSQLRYVEPWYSPSGSFARLSFGPGNVACDAKLAIKVYLSNVKLGQKLNLSYFVTGRGDILVKGTKKVQVTAVGMDLTGALDGTKSPVQVNVVEFEIQVTPAFYAWATLMVFYVREDGEVVTAQANLPVHECFPNAVTLQWDAESKNPGATAGLNIHSTPGSLCGLSVVDRRVTSIQPYSQLTSENVLRRAFDFHIYSYAFPTQFVRDYEYCKAEEFISNQTTGNAKTKSAIEGEWRSASYYQDAIKAFDDAGLLVLSNSNMQTRPCYKYYQYDQEQRSAILNEVPAPTTSAPSSHVDSKVRQTRAVSPVPSAEKRVNFPETWLWEMYTTDSKGDTKVEQKLPNKKTAWVGRAFCLSSTAGFGMSADAKIIAV